MTGQIYIDMDGVVADFERGIINVFGEEYSDRVADRFWKRTCVEAQVFRQMPAIPEGMCMVAEIAKTDSICFMTSTGGLPHHIDIAKQKLDWLRSHGLGDHPVAFCMNTAGKGRYASPGAILIDDRAKVCEAWRKGGGRSILFTRERASFIPDEI